jgi:hypothetical protein
MLRLVKTGAEGDGQSMDVMEINKPDDLGDIANLGLSLAEAKRLLASLQQEIVAAQAKTHAVRRPDCRCGSSVCHVKDYRDHRIATLFGQVTLRLPRFCCAACGAIEVGIDWPSHCRSTPELDQLQAHLSALSTDDPARMAAKAVIVAEAERLHWRICNGKAQNAQKRIDRIRTVMHQFQGEPGRKKSIASSRKLWTALQALDGHLSGQSNWLINYAERQRAGLRVGTAITEGTANFLVNRRMNKSQQMRWSRRGADLLLQVRCAVYNGTFGSAHRRKFQPANDSSPPMAIAA